MTMLALLSAWTEEDLRNLLTEYRALGPLPGIVLPFLKSFIPPLPTLVIVGLNAAIYGLWPGFLYSWLGLVGGCLAAFLLARAAATHRYFRRFARKPKVQKGMEWVQHNAFSYVFLLSLFPVGPFVVINLVAALSGMRLRSFAIALSFGKAIMVFAVSYIGHDLAHFVSKPFDTLYVVLFIGLSLWISKRVESRFARPRAEEALPAAADLKTEE